MVSKDANISFGKRYCRDSDKPAVVLTGISGRLGRLLAQRLHRTERVIGIDRRPFPDRPKDIIFHQVDIRRKKAENIFRAGSIKAVIHTNILHNPRASAAQHHSFNVLGTTRILEYCYKYCIPKVVVLSSANIYGPRSDNSNFLTEDAPLLGGQTYPQIRDLIEIDMYANSFFWKHPEIETVILRPVHILGKVKNAPSNYFRLKNLPFLMGFNPMMQVIHEDDVVEAILLSLKDGIRGVFNISGPTEVPQSTLRSLTGKPSLPIPHILADSILKFLWKWKLTSYQKGEIDHAKYICMVDGSRARDILGFRPQKSIEDCIKTVLAKS